MSILIVYYRAEAHPVSKMCFLPDSKRLLEQKPHILPDRTSILIASHRAENTHSLFKMCRIERKAHPVKQDVDSNRVLSSEKHMPLNRMSIFVVSAAIQVIPVITDGFVVSLYK
ncbi:hypothetical protein AVEN_256483-1 [Araneus ventricosus]|uniref:Uncharacterized protein n=1 Tax=Araneus ventricosus TaxID=182803 RepID=A0A4Y2U9N8_ARAVE|nr:hypothetical protein AVEN_256483-1 [Araneus ventricosus]